MVDSPPQLRGEFVDAWFLLSRWSFLVPCLVVCLLFLFLGSRIVLVCRVEF